MKRCNFCGNEQFTKVFKTIDYKTNKVFSVYRCSKCELGFTSPIPQKKDLVKFYEGYRDNNSRRFWTPVEKFIYFWHKRRVKHIKRLINKGKILDIGCGRALELEILKKDGWSTFATEFSEDLEKNLQAKGIQTFFCEIWQIKGKNNTFDVISMWHSLEHMSNPSKVIETSGKLLRKSGYLIIEVPNFATLERKLFSEFWFHLDVPRHLYHFSRKNLEEKLRQNHFRIISEKHIAPEYDFFSFWQGSLNKIFSRYPNIIYRFLLRDYKTGYSKMIIILLQTPVLIFIMVISVFAVPFLWLNKQSGTIEITVQKVS